MNKRIWLALIASTILGIGVAPCLIAQSGGSETAGPAAIPKAIPPGRYAHDPKLRQLFPEKPPSHAKRDAQAYEKLAQLKADTAAQKADFIEFDAPGAGTSGGLGTEPVGINLLGEITGYYIDSSFAEHGFLRYPGGEIATFDAPGSNGFTAPVAINLEGEITGNYTDAESVSHGFLRTRDGDFITFEVPGAGTGPSDGTFPVSDGTFPMAINIEGAITGSYCHMSGAICYGFLRAGDGTITTFDPSGSLHVFPAGIDDFWAITGTYEYQSNYPGFLRDPTGHVIRFDPPNSEGTFPGAISPLGAIIGDYLAPENNPFGFLVRGFVRKLDGSLATFDAATYPPCCIFTYPTAINLEGTITGYDRDGFDVYHGFVRAPNGSITTFDAPNAGTGDSQGTLPSGVNLEGAITGYYIDANMVQHGFVRIKR